MKTKLKQNNKAITSSKNQKGITLIALVITIIVLIILAGVALNLSLGENGLFQKTEYAKEQYEMAAVREKLNLAMLEMQTEEIDNGELTLDTMLTKLQEKLPGIIIEKDGETLKGTVDGYDFVIDSDFKVTIEGYNPEAGNGGSEDEETTFTVTLNGTNVTSDGATQVNKNASYTATLTPKKWYEITEITVKMGETILMQGTHYTYLDGSLTISNVIGNLEIVSVVEQVIGYDKPYIPTGFSHIGIEDWNSGYRISDTGDETGNIFVWVPCVLSQDDVKEGDVVETFRKILPKTTEKTDLYYMYNKDNFTITGEEETASEIETSVEKYGGFYIAAYEAGIEGNIDNYNLEEKTSINTKPLSKVGCGVWNYITNDEAMVVAKSMIDTSTTGAKSALISGTCWDTTLQWMVNSSTNAEENKDYDINSEGKGWYKDISNSEVHTTGYCAVNNIYDMAGNVLEWTTEIFTKNGSNSLIYRGGVYDVSVLDFSAAHRGGSRMGATYGVSFRVVMYK